MPKIIPEGQIFEAVLKTIAEKGYAGATTKHISRVAGVNEVTLFRKFGTKKELVRQSMIFVFNHSDISEFTKYTGDIRTDLIRIISAYKSTTNKYGDFMMRMILEFSQHPELRESFGQPLGIIKEVTSIISIYQKEKVLSPENPFHTIAALFGPMFYSTMLPNIFTENPVDPLEPENLVDKFLEGRLQR